MLKTKIYIILAILAVSLFEEIYAKGGMGKNSGRRKKIYHILLILYQKIFTEFVKKKIFFFTSLVAAGRKGGRGRGGGSGRNRGGYAGGGAGGAYGGGDCKFLELKYLFLQTVETLEVPTF